LGLEACEQKEGKSLYYNSAFCVLPEKGVAQQYNKHLLLPMGEYIPFEWAKSLAAQYGLFDSFQHGKNETLFYFGSHIAAPSICYEDTFPFLGRNKRTKNTTLLLNLTNDNWFPNSALGRYHAELARIRAIEMGRPIIRSCNFGVSGAINALGKNSDLFEYTDLQKETEGLPIEVSSYVYTTWYLEHGNSPMIVTFCLFVFVDLLLSKLKSVSRKRKLQHATL
jgi:apolipoprotein N-acyltransferase